MILITRSHVHVDRLRFFSAPRSFLREVVSSFMI
jgi:hypothetical protein